MLQGNYWPNSSKGPCFSFLGNGRGGESIYGGFFEGKNVYV